MNSAIDASRSLWNRENVKKQRVRYRDEMMDSWIHTSATENLTKKKEEEEEAKRV